MLLPWNPTLEITAPPMPGTVRFATADVGIPKGSECSNSVYGTVILYTPAPGLVGQDQFTLHRARDAMAFNWIGLPSGPRTYTVTVRPARQAFAERFGAAGGGSSDTEAFAAMLGDLHQPAGPTNRRDGTLGQAAEHPQIGPLPCVVFNPDYPPTTGAPATTLRGAAAHA